VFSIHESERQLLNVNGMNYFTTMKNAKVLTQYEYRFEKTDSRVDSAKKEKIWNCRQHCQRTGNERYKTPFIGRTEIGLKHRNDTKMHYTQTWVFNFKRTKNINCSFLTENELHQHFILRSLQCSKTAQFDLPNIFNIFNTCIQFSFHKDTRQIKPQDLN